MSYALLRGFVGESVRDLAELLRMESVAVNEPFLLCGRPDVRIAVDVEELHGVDNETISIDEGVLDVTRFHDSHIRNFCRSLASSESGILGFLDLKFFDDRLHLKVRPYGVSKESVACSSTHTPSRVSVAFFPKQLGKTGRCRSSSTLGERSVLSRVDDGIQPLSLMVPPMVETKIVLLQGLDEVLRCLLPLVDFHRNVVPLLDKGCKHDSIIRHALNEFLGDLWVCRDR